jgi:hypothetical protein
MLPHSSMMMSRFLTAHKWFFEIYRAQMLMPPGRSMVTWKGLQTS